MKEIREMFNIKVEEKKIKEDNTFSLMEVIIITISISVLASIGTGFIVNYLTKTDILEDKELRDITNTYQKIMDTYYEEVDKNGIANAAIDGMMTFLDENYSIHLSDDASSDLEEKLQGTYDGIGVEIGKTVDSVIITRVFEGTPASDAGILPGDILIQVNKFKIKDDTDLEEVITNIKGDKEVKLVVLRDKEELEFICKIKHIEIPVVSTEVFKKDDSKVGYLYLETFSSNAHSQVERELKKLESEGIDSLIIDLRGNTGGYLNVATDIASLFLKRNKTIYSLESKNDVEVVKDTTDTFRTLPIVVLINGGTASASEILAAALKESYGAIIVGSQSYGKGKVQQTSKLSDDTLVKYTTASWYTPTGDNVEGIGLEPGITVELSDDYFKHLTSEYDNQLQKALELVSQ